MTDTSGEKARSEMNALLKKYTISQDTPLLKAGELDYVAFQKELREKAKNVAKEMEKNGECLSSPTGRDCRATDLQEELTRRYYRAADEVLGVIPKADWERSSPVINSLKRGLNAVLPKDLALDVPPANAELKDIVPDHGLQCTPKSTSITNVQKCSKSR